MTAAVFVDSNVFVYSRDVGQPRKRELAANWLEYLWREQLGRTSVQVLSEYYVTVTRKLDPGLSSAEAWDSVSELMAWHPQPNDENVLRRARDIELRYRVNWWDCLIVAAAQLQGCALLLSEDLQDGGVYGGVTVRSPFTLAINEPAAAYTVTPKVAARHRPRGRPRRSLERQI